MVRMIAGRLIEKTTETEPLTIVVNPTVTWNPSASPLQITLKDWNRGFELGDLSEWTALDAEISLVDPYEGNFCCRLKNTGSKITQTLDDPFPVIGVWMFRFRARSESETTLKPIALYTDGTSSEGGQTIFPDEWTDVFMLRQDMNAEKILSGIEIESSDGEIFIDDVFLGLATELIAGAVEASQGTPRNLQGEMIARPKGEVLESGEVTFTGAAAAWQRVVFHTPDDGDRFQLAKILVSCEEAAVYQLRWGGTVIGAEEVYVTGGFPFTDWFPWGCYEMEGDGSLMFELWVIDPSDSSTATCYAEIVGEDVPSKFNL